MEQLYQDFPNDVRIVFRHYPLIGTPEEPFHDKAAITAQAAEAAGRQDKFWEMHDVILAKQAEWVNMTPDEFQSWVVERAEELSLDTETFITDMQDPEIVAKIQEAWEHGQLIQIPGTPFLLVNGNPWPNSVPMDYWSIAAVTKLTLLEKQQFTTCPPMSIDPTKLYKATLHTDLGDVVLELFADKAPIAVNSFIFLAQNGWFDNVTFHRVIPGFVAQAGDPTGTGFGGPGYAFINETIPELKFDRPGLLAMANDPGRSNFNSGMVSLMKA